jgi:hypothetical protein
MTSRHFGAIGTGTLILITLFSLLSELTVPAFELNVPLFIMSIVIAGIGMYLLFITRNDVNA